MSASPFRVACSAVALAVLAPLVLFVGQAGAHRIDESYIYVDVYDNAVEGRLEFNVREINAALDLGIPGDDIDAAEVAVAEHRDVIEAYAAEHFGIGIGGVEWRYSFTDVEMLDTENGIFAILAFDVDESFDAAPTVLDVRYEAFFDDVAGHVALFHIGTYWEAGVFNNESDALNILLPFSASTTRQSFDLQNPSFWKGFKAVVKLGVDHIHIGTDHILFVLALLLPAVLVFRSGAWQPSAGFRSSLWRVTKLATMFTIAHSITLSLAGLDVIELPTKPVEVIIALSIILAALHNLRPVFANREWALAFGFGLFHGLGFASLLSDLGLDRSNRVWSLLAFNLGVELGQVAIIMLVFPSLYLLRRTRLYAVGLKLASVLIAFVALGWMIERVFETDLRVNELVDPLVETPRAYVLVALVTVAALGWRQFEQAQGTLREPAPSERDDEAALVS